MRLAGGENLAVLFWPDFLHFLSFMENKMRYSQQNI